MPVINPSLGNLEDVRKLRDVIANLQQRVKKLETSTIPVIAHQRGPTPGWIAAGQIGPGTSMKSAMHLHLDGNQVGVAPRLSIADANGVVRFETGNLAANGISQAQFGFRGNNASGAPIVDAFGPISGGVMASLGISSLSGAQNFTTTTPTLATGTNMTITIANRAQNVLCLAIVIGSVTAGTANGQWRINPGAAGSPSGNAQLGGANAQTQMAWLWLSGVAVGSYTFQLEGSVSATPTTFNMTGANLQVFQLGS